MDELQGVTTLERELIKKSEQIHLPINGSIELLPLCNLNCDMCYVRLSHEEMEAQGRLRTAEEWLKIGRQMKDAGVLFLLLTGGEPLLYPDFKEVYCGLKELGMILTINTNGTLLNEEWADFFREHPPRRINITLYGSSKGTYERLCHNASGFEAAVKAIRLLKERGVSVKIGGSATVGNADEIEEIVSIGKELEVPVVVDTYMMPAVREKSRGYNHSARLAPEEAARIRIRMLRSEMGEKEFQEYRSRMVWEIEHILPEKEPRGVTCMAGRCSFTINWQGEMRPCVVVREPAMSVFEHGFEAAWSHVVSETEKIRLNPKCSSCNLRPVCRTCAACALLEAGSYDALPDYMCRYAKESEKQFRLDKD